MTKILDGNFEKSFLVSEKMAPRKIFRRFLHAIFFMFVLLISNRTVLLVQYEINLHLKLYSPKRLVQFSSVF